MLPANHVHRQYQGYALTCEVIVALSQRCALRSGLWNSWNCSQSAVRARLSAIYAPAAAGPAHHSGLKKSRPPVYQALPVYALATWYASMMFLLIRPRLLGL